MAQSSIVSCNAALDARNKLLNGGKIEIRTGAAADIDATQTGVLLETIPLQAVAFNTASSRVSSANLPASILATSTAIAGEKHYIAYNSSNGIERSGSAGTSGADLILNTDSWNVGDTLGVTSWATSESK